MFLFFLILYDIIYRESLTYFYASITDNSNYIKSSQRAQKIEENAGLLDNYRAQ